MLKAWLKCLASLNSRDRLAQILLIKRLFNNAKRTTSSFILPVLIAAWSWSRGYWRITQWSSGKRQECSYLETIVFGLFKEIGIPGEKSLLHGGNRQTSHRKSLNWFETNNFLHSGAVHDTTAACEKFKEISALYARHHLLFYYLFIHFFILLALHIMQNPQVHYSWTEKVEIWFHVRLPAGFWHFFSLKFCQRQMGSSLGASYCVVLLTAWSWSLWSLCLFPQMSLPPTCSTTIAASLNSNNYISGVHLLHLRAYTCVFSLPACVCVFWVRPDLLQHNPSLKSGNICGSKECA